MIFISLLLTSGSGIAGQLPSEEQAEKSAPHENTAPTATNGPVQVSEEILEKLSPGEKKWYCRFQEGVPFFDGWEKITQAVVEKFPEHERKQRLEAMHKLGLKIGYEWSRDNRVRKVNTDMLRAWGRDLRKAGAESHVQLAEVLYKIDNEMDSLLHLQ